MIYVSFFDKLEHFYGSKSVEWHLFFLSFFFLDNGGVQTSLDNTSTKPVSYLPPMSRDIG